jgi:uncharacterized membrane protein
MIGNEVSRISPIITNNYTPEYSTNQTTNNLIPAIVAFGCVLLVGVIVLQYKQQRIDETQDELNKHIYN